MSLYKEQSYYVRRGSPDHQLIFLEDQFRISGIRFKGLSKCNLHIYSNKVKEKKNEMKTYENLNIKNKQFKN